MVFIPFKKMLNIIILTVCEVHIYVDKSNTSFIVFKEAAELVT